MIPTLSTFVKEFVASEAITTGKLLNLYSAGGVARVRLADATAEGGEVDFVSMTSGSSSSVIGCALPGQIIPGFSGLYEGSTYFLSTTPGEIVQSPPSSIGNVVQVVGKAVSSTELLFFPQAPITLV